jgi:hypothetical protein
LLKTKGAHSFAERQSGKMAARWWRILISSRPAPAGLFMGFNIPKENYWRN